METSTWQFQEQGEGETYVCTVMGPLHQGGRKILAKVYDPAVTRLLKYLLNQIGKEG